MNHIGEKPPSAASYGVGCEGMPTKRNGEPLFPIPEIRVPAPLAQQPAQQIHFSVQRKLKWMGCLLLIVAIALIVLGSLGCAINPLLGGLTITVGVALLGAVWKIYMKASQEGGLPEGPPIDQLNNVPYEGKKWGVDADGRPAIIPA